MNLQAKSPILVWTCYLFIAVKAISDYIRYNPKWGRSDEVLLYATIFIVLWVERDGIISTIRDKEFGYPVTGAITGMIGMLIYLIGRSFPLMMFEIWSFFIIASGIVLTFAPKNKVNAAITVGASGTVLVILGKAAPELLSSKLAVGIASLSAKFLSVTFIPVVSNGVYLYFGPYIAEVTHACSGMNSIFSIFALSLLYLKDERKRKAFHLLTLVLLVIPVAIVTNLIRVIMLVVATWTIGDWFSSGPFHETIGIIVFLLALGIMYISDVLLFSIYKTKE